MMKGRRQNEDILHVTYCEITPHVWILVSKYLFCQMCMNSMIKNVPACARQLSLTTTPSTQTADTPLFVRKARPVVASCFLSLC